MPESSAETAMQLQHEGAQLRLRARYAEAEQILLRALDLKHDCAAAHLELALTYRTQGRPDDALDYLQLAVHFEPGFVDGWIELGTTLAQFGRTDAAIDALNRAAALQPRNAAPWRQLGTLHKSAENWAAAIDCYRTAVVCSPAADSMCLLGYALYQAGDFAQARAEFESALRLAPDMLAAHHDLGLVFLATGEPEPALACFGRALAIDPNVIETRACVAHALRDLGRLDEAITRYDEVLAIDPDFADAVINRGYALLMKGDYAAGWAAYDERFGRGGQPGRKFRYPQWRGERLDGKRLLVYAEQGLGDEIMFASCLNDLLAQAGNCVIECNRRLASLFKRSFPAAHVHGGNKQDDDRWLENVPAVELQAAIGSLPRYFRRTPDAFPRDAGYLRADRARTDNWRARLDAAAALRVGIAWRGGTLRSRQHLRSIPLAAWTPLLHSGQAAFYALQYGDTAAETAAVADSAGVSINQPGAAIDDLDELAALIDALDLVISVDNTVAHLAGALGKPVWTLLPCSPEWRYPRSGATMPWYPSMRLFHRMPAESSQTLIERVAVALADMTPQHSRA